MKLLYWKHIILSFFIMGGSIACTKIMPTATKPTVPDDHTKDIEGVLHKPGFEEPMELIGGCSDRFCHGTALEGGVAIVDEKPAVAPSCFQCHDDKWNDDESSAAPVFQMPLESSNE